MPLLYLFWFLLLISVFIYPLCKSHSSKIAFLSFCFLLMLYVHSMVDVNSIPDIYEYRDGFNQTFNMPIERCFIWGESIIKIEPGFVVFLKLMSTISRSFRFFLIVTSAIMLICYYILIRKYSTNYSLSVLFLLLGQFGISMYVLRQYLVISLFLIAFPLIHNKKLWKFLLLTVLCFTIHQTAVLFVLVYYFYNCKDRNLFINLIILGVVLFLGFQLLVNFSAEYLSGYGSYIIENDKGQNLKQPLLWIFYLLLYLYFAKKHALESGINRFVFVLTALSVVFYIAGIGVWAVGRMVWYYSAILFLLIPLIVSYMRKRYIRIIFVSFSILVQYYMTFLGSNWDNIGDMKLIDLLF